ncbi:MAG: glycosyltransferase family 4 protein [Chloroflexi bacterium]|nr:glycosyltransferase family 4 protein [Chloroflexota bacterium]
MKPIKVGLYCDREDWILGTIARQIERVHGRSGKFEFLVSSWQKFMDSPVDQTRKLRECDVVHWLEPDGYMRFGSLIRGTPQICTINHSLPGDGRRAEHYAGARVLTISEMSRNELVSRGFPDPAVINTGIDESLFTPLDRNSCRRDLDIATDRLMIGFFGKESSNPSDRKGVQTLIESVSILAPELPLAVMLSGEGWDDLTNRLESLGAQVFHRPVDTLDKMSLLYGAIDLYLCTSRIEGGPVPVLEAMACARPVVSTPVGHIPELIQDGANGLIVPIDAPQQTAEAIRKALNDPEFRRRLAEAGRATILASWTWDKVLKPIGPIYERVAALSDNTRSNGVSATKAMLMLLLRSAKHKMRSASR